MYNQASIYKGGGVYKMGEGGSDVNLISIKGVKVENTFTKAQGDYYFESSFKEIVALPAGYEKLDYIIPSSITTESNHPLLIVSDFELPQDFGSIFASWKFTRLGRPFSAVFCTPFVNDNTNIVRCIAEQSSIASVVVNVNSSAAAGSTSVPQCSGIELKSNRTARKLDSSTLIDVKPNQGLQEQSRKLGVISPTANMKLFFIFVVDNSKNVTFTGIPCKHGSDYGIYDLVADRFYTNPIMTGA